MTNYLLSVSFLFQLGITVLFVLYVPGYTLSYWLFPRHTLDNLERVFVALTTSIALSSLVGFSLLRFWGQHQLLRFVLVMTILTIIFSIGGFWRNRSQVSKLFNHSFRPSFLLKFSHYLALLLILLLLVAIAISGAWLVYQPTTTGLIEFYIPPQNLPTLLKNPINPEGLLAIPVRITNQAASAVTCRVEARVDGQKMWELPGIVINTGETWQETITIPWLKSTKPSWVELDLFSNFSNTPTAQLLVWMEPDPTDR